MQLHVVLQLPLFVWLARCLIEGEKVVTQELAGLMQTTGHFTNAAGFTDMQKL